VAVQKRVGTEDRFDQMHEISRHSIHVAEILDATIGNMSELQRYQTDIHKHLPTELDKSYREQAKEYMRFQISLLKSLRLRSESNQKRLNNEVNLVSLMDPFLDPLPLPLVRNSWAKNV
jgi:hypothetical protein